MERILVTGANGFVAYYLINQLLQGPYEVLATGRSKSRLPFSGIKYHYEILDFTDASRCEELFAKFQPQFVVHCGANSKPDECELDRPMADRVNVEGTIHLLRAAALYGSHFIFLSTDFVFSGDGRIYDEADERIPVNYYGETKVRAEDEVMRYPYSWTIIRTALVYGKPFLSRQNLLTSTAQALKEGRALKIFKDQTRTSTWVGDLAGAIIKVIEIKAEGIFHVAGADVSRPYEMALAVARYLSLDASLITPVVEAEFHQPARRPPSTRLNISRARGLLDFHPTSFEEGLRLTFD